MVCPWCQRVENPECPQCNLAKNFGLKLSPPIPPQTTLPKTNPNQPNNSGKKQPPSEQSINSAKEKLKSKSKFSAKRNKRNNELKAFFKNLPTNPKEFIEFLENIKVGLSKKLTSEEIDNLCQAK
ncbi:uncharacterized protein OCT59_018735 [Rhizophagus irregularis]|uniref:Uncharacterized protein n=3 Tax=Rhizophagus irregularis TaxID=588596 RepID=A0A916EE99_9GLOM|nr:hypothetical protein RirG_035770 [Rhizophagus irregularis DAOM 197198w]UZO26517.1 hypothetical protein OCT59_018735 [Rhizophagus irregularis]GBC34576.1 hypothetical protein GLOIN_2v1835499 [Rhizophagus irregularis DAOM 181602=DAOM 197198]CAB4376900.1 unnamed protein product [Rhizophagus irregularis]CAB4487832.1 unnamed protein product [Rhizophagus irregularis]